jgi:hypothetical protein
MWKTLKLLQENIGKNLKHLEIDSDFLDAKLKAQSMKNRNNKPCAGG